mmetsp:Transcript_117711/g.313138  ORF Transcript_117711/g.313138 Transcript_117711/m.313138 type:complete len:209 (-) Transcript_117711:766-1392(-)
MLWTVLETIRSHRNTLINAHRGRLASVLQKLTLWRHHGSERFPAHQLEASKPPPSPRDLPSDCRNLLTYHCRLRAGRRGARGLGQLGLVADGQLSGGRVRVDRDPPRPPPLPPRTPLPPRPPPQPPRAAAAVASQRARPLSRAPRQRRFAPPGLPQSRHRNPHTAMRLGCGRQPPAPSHPSQGLTCHSRPKGAGTRRCRCAAAARRRR